MKYAWIKDHRHEFPVAVMCKILKVGSSGFYDWQDRQPSPQQQRREEIARAAARSYFESKRIYGYRKVYADLREDNFDCCRETVRRVMAQMGLYSRVKRKFVVTTDSNHNLPITILSVYYISFTKTPEISPVIALKCKRIAQFRF